MTATMALIEELFLARLAALASEHGLTDAETERIAWVFRQAAANPFMTEQHIFRKLSGEDF
ncbi:hypothetical protein [Desulfococcus sp.]|jgi:hypothetical protein|uniref:hypothetical protein n=1 Tax=Desulfococcus sp. TaxID=2025834 RepID=UPI00359432EE